MGTEETKTMADAKAVAADVKTEVLTKEQKIEAWFARHFQGNAIAAREEIYNLCHAAKEELKKIL